jgi:dUTP pyrophosphatase
MKYFKVNSEAKNPEYATSGSAAFDLSACLTYDTKIRMYNPHNKEMTIPVKRFNNHETYGVQLMPGYRMLIPTGLKFDIPEKHVLKIAIRSSTALKSGLTLANQIGIIDSDYVDEVYVMIYNIADTPFILYHGDRIAQGFLEKNIQEKLEETTEDIIQKTDRNGGLGSTGTSEIKRGPGRPRKEE